MLKCYRFFGNARCGDWRILRGFQSAKKLSNLLDKIFGDGKMCRYDKRTYSVFHV